MSIAIDARSALDPAALFARAFGLPALDWQRDYLRAGGNIVLNKSRQIGASTANAVIAISATLFEANVNAVIVSPSQKQSTEITAKARTGLRNLGVRLQQDSSQVLGLANGSRIVSLPGTARSVRGWSARVLIIDESAFVLDETWTAARALVATGGRLVVSSTPARATGPFYELVTGDEPDWTRFTVPASVVPTISTSWLEAERRALGADAFASEYECEFGRTGGGLFTPEMIDSMFQEESA